MQIVIIEAGPFAQPAPAQDRERAGSQLGTASPPQRLQGAIGRDQRHPQHLPDLKLGQREAAGPAVAEPGGARAHQVLTEQVSDPCDTRSRPVVGDRLAEKSRIEQCLTPHREPDVRGLDEQLLQLLVGK